MRVLFVCGRNRRRSPGAGAVEPRTADAPLEREVVEWADIIFVMEERQRRKLGQQYGGALKGTKVVCLDIPDDYRFMDAKLQALLVEKVTPFLV